MSLDLLSLQHLTPEQWIFLGFIGLGCYVQAVMGFAGGLIVMGGVAMFHLMAIHPAAIIMNLVSLVNTVMALRNSRGNIRGKWSVAVLLGALPTTLVGLWILSYLSSSDQDLLKLLLGVVIILSCLTLVLKRPELPAESKLTSFALFGAFAGIIGGLFSTYGPILVYHFYRQPVALKYIRDTLLAVFTVTSLVRVLFIIAGDQFPDGIWFMTMLSLPVVILATWLGRRFPPPVPDQVLKKLAFVILVISGFSMIAPVLWGNL